jgi:hypothetical protein
MAGRMQPVDQSKTDFGQRSRSFDKRPKECRIRSFLIMKGLALKEFPGLSAFEQGLCVF